MFSIYWMRRLAAAALVVAGSPAFANSYTLVDLGADMIPGSMNDRGEILAGHRTHERQVAWVYKGGHWRRVIKTDEDISPVAMNQRGDMAGNSGADHRPGILPRRGDFQAVDAPPTAWAGTLSKNRTVVGVYQVGEHYRCYRTPWQGSWADMGLPDERATYCNPVAVNDKGWVAGTVLWNEDTVQISLAWIWRDGVFINLGSLTTKRNWAWAASMNRAGKVVGYSENEQGRLTAFLWDGSLMLDIGMSNRFHATLANSISNRGEIVGSGLADDHLQHAVRFAHGRVISLEDEVTNLGSMTLTNAFSVNDDGAIIGHGFVGDRMHGFLLVPQ